MIGIGAIEVAITLILLILIGAAFLILIKRPGDGNHNASGSVGARETLDERYARGEIDRDDYQRMRQDIES